MTDDGGSDAKVVCVQAKDPRWEHIQDLDDISQFTRKEIEHFFEHYKDLEPGKWVKIDGWGDAAEADAIVQAGIAKLADNRSWRHLDQVGVTRGTPQPVGRPTYDMRS